MAARTVRQAALILPLLGLSFVVGCHGSNEGGGDGARSAPGASAPATGPEVSGTSTPESPNRAANKSADQVGGQDGAPP